MKMKIISNSKQKMQNTYLIHTEYKNMHKRISLKGIQQTINCVKQNPLCINKKFQAVIFFASVEKTYTN